jgi:hypothetical protein
MAKLSISKASKEWGLARKTVQDAVKSGELKTELGARNSKNVDTADLLRLFGEPKTGQNSGKAIGEVMYSGGDNQVNMTNKLISQLEAENASLKESAAFLQSLIQSHLSKINNLEEELAEYRKPVKRLGWFGRK